MVARMNHRPPGLAGAASAMEHKARGERLAERLPSFVPLIDDGLADEEWVQINPEREYRIRPHRPCDGEPATDQIPCVTVIHVPTGAAGRGVPVDSLKIMGAIAYPRDDDQWAEWLFVDQWGGGVGSTGALH